MRKDGKNGSASVAEHWLFLALFERIREEIPVQCDRLMRLAGNRGFMAVSRL
jgi:hypothetical protein